MPIVTHDMNDYDMLRLYFSGASMYYAGGILNRAIWFHDSIREVTIQLSGPSVVRISHCTNHTHATVVYVDCCIIEFPWVA
jgi:hypothetical protein